jgi:predicted acylesterase/phospholipase RssA
MKYTLRLVILLPLLYGLTGELHAQSYQKPGNRVLVVSGGGARGAWGVGVARSLYEEEGGYRAVFGTSTGSLMAPMILLQQFDSLESYYTRVTQKDIFSKNPFKVKTVNGVVTTELKSFNAFWRLLWNKPTLGETENLRDLIKKCFRPEDFQALKARSPSDGLSLHVAVTNMTNGNSEVKTSDEISGYDEMVNWIWASSNQPVFMSYTVMSGTPYVDGGLREIVPLRAAVVYAVKHRIDTVDVIVNDSWEPQQKNWSVEQNKGYFKGGLMRVLDVYNANTLYYDLRSAALMTELHDERVQTGQAPGSSALTVIVYSMPDSVANQYKDELGFDRVKMAQFVKKGKAFIKEKQFVEGNTRHVYRPR